MANEVRTFIEVKSDKNETFKKLQDLFGGADYKTMYETDWLYHKLYGEKEYDRGVYTEEMGAKWCYVDDLDADEGVFTMTTVSAWYFCEGAIRKIQEILQEVDEEVCVAFTYEDESLDPVGGGACYKGEMFTYEESIGYPNYDDYENEEDYDTALEEVYDKVYEVCEGLKNEAVVDVYDEMNYEEIEASQDEEE